MNGLIKQWGIKATSDTNTVQIDLSLAYSNTNYAIAFTHSRSGTSPVVIASISAEVVEEQYFKTRGYDGPIRWFTIGY